MAAIEEVKMKDLSVDVAFKAELKTFVIPILDGLMISFIGSSAVSLTAIVVCWGEWGGGSGFWVLFVLFVLYVVNCWKKEKNLQRHEQFQHTLEQIHQTNHLALDLLQTIEVSSDNPLATSSYILLQVLRICSCF